MGPRGWQDSTFPLRGRLDSLIEHEWAGSQTRSAKVQPEAITMFTTGMRYVWLPAVAVLLLAGTAHAAVQYLSREHSVFARANQVSDEETATSAPAATLRAEADGSNAEFRSTAFATQDVEVGDGG